MVKKYYSQNGQSLMDICVQLYGSPDLMNKLLSDNGIIDRNKSPKPNTLFYYDTDYVTDLQVLNKGLQYVTALPPEFDDDAQAYIDAVTGAGYTISKTEKAGINTFVVALKSYGLWKRIGDKAIYPMAGNTANSHKFNLLNPLDTDGAYRLTYTGSPTHNANGITGVSNSFADTHLPANSFSGGDISAAVYIKAHNGHGFQFGAYSGAGSNGLALGAAYDNVTYWAASMDFGNDAYADTSGVGFYMVNAKNSITANRQQLYKNGSLVRNYTRTPANEGSTNIYLLNDSGNAHSFFNPTWSPDTISFASFLVGMTANDAISYYNAVANLITSFGR